MHRLQPLSNSIRTRDNSAKAICLRTQYVSNRCSGLLNPDWSCNFLPDLHPTESKSNLSSVEFTPFRHAFQRIQEKLDPWGFEIIVKNYSIGDGILVTSDLRPYIFDIDHDFDGLIADTDSQKWEITLHVRKSFFSVLFYLLLILLLLKYFLVLLSFSFDARDARSLWSFVIMPITSRPCDAFLCKTF